MNRNVKRYSEEYVEKIHEYLLSCCGIATGDTIKDVIHISLNYAHCCAREAVRRYDDIEVIQGLGYRKKGIKFSYQITANLYSAESNDYIYHWDGPTFKRLSALFKARKTWEGWWPPEDELKKQIDIWKKEQPNDDLEVEIGLWDGEGNEIEFYNVSARYYE